MIGFVTPSDHCALVRLTSLARARTLQCAPGWPILGIYVMGVVHSPKSMNEIDHRAAPLGGAAIAAASIRSLARQINYHGMGIK